MALLPEPKLQAEFLKAANFAPLAGTRGWAKAKITDEPRMGKYGVDVPVEITKKPFILTLNPERQDYALVGNALGKDPEDWVGSVLKLGLRDGKTKDGTPTKYLNVLGVE